MSKLLDEINYIYFVRYRKHGYTIALSHELQSDWIFYYANR